MLPTQSDYIIIYNNVYEGTTYISPHTERYIMILYIANLRTLTGAIDFVLYIYLQFIHIKISIYVRIWSIQKQAK